MSPNHSCYHIDLPLSPLTCLLLRVSTVRIGCGRDSHGEILVVACSGQRIRRLEIPHKSEKCGDVSFSHHSARSPRSLWEMDRSTVGARCRAGVTALAQRCSDVAEYSSIRISVQHFPPVSLSSFLQSCLQAIVHSFYFIASHTKRPSLSQFFHAKPPISAN